MRMRRGKRDRQGQEWQSGVEYRVLLELNAINNYVGTCGTSKVGTTGRQQ